MALSGTTLTVTTLTTAGLLTNNVSGQVSSVTGTSLASLLGGAPTFTGLTLSGLNTGILKVTSGVVGLASSGDYQAALTQGLNISINPSTNVIATSASPSFTGLTLSSINASMLKTVSGVVTGAVAYTDYMPNITTPTGSNITINTGANTISVNNPPTFVNILNSTTNTNNVLHGTSAGNGLTTGNANTLLGSSTGTAITTGAQNIALGYLAGGTVTTGTYNTYIGTNAQASGINVTGEIIIGSSASTITGKGSNTALISATSGLYSYTPYSINLWNNNAATVSQVEQWVLNNTTNSGIANIGSTPTITSGVITNIPIGVYNINITGSLYGSSQTYYPTLQYRASGGSFVTIALAFPSFGSAWTCPITITANVRISNVADAIRLWYDTGTPYNNVGTVPAIYYGNYLPRYMTITFISI